ncbi:reverse transcriptase-like protein [Novosphingobium sp. KCTC 2891]|uniref:reverse transcriptase-like protein n=1 Tax=Novosphingobium sp. KCTC 2891 TaxID=2989730 RepID=UPI0022238664|nr:reverse transcriptase-like protein [Novosphingobium sp. KCTC 2891]MCW1383582.1 reverse transcriptase-like protein [Novosphingobium sp. KCTC 2891]
MKIYFDGGCRPNPGPLETMVFASGKAHHCADLGLGDNSDAEWLALIHAATIAREGGHSDVTLLGDSALIVGQANGTAKCRDERFHAYLAQFRALAAGFARVRVRRIGRAQNLAGIALERLRAGL